MNSLAGAEAAPRPVSQVISRPSPAPAAVVSSGQRACHPTLWLLVPMFGLLAARYLFAPTDFDYWWHLRTGQLILDTGTIPRADVFSYTSFGQPWVPHEWLTQVVYAILERSVGFVGLASVWAALGTALWVTVYRTARLRGLGEPAAIILVLMAAAMAVSVTAVRPQVLTALCLAVTALLITRFKAGHARALWPLPALLALWVNLHGGYVIGLVLLGVTLVGETLSRIIGRPAAPLKPLAIITMLSGLATLLSPNGLDALWYPFTYAGTGNGSMRHISEWQSPNFHDPTFLVFGASVLFALILGVGRRPLGITEVLWALLFTFMALTSLRHIPLFAIVVTPLIAGRLAVEAPWLARPMVSWRRPALLAVAWPLLLSGLLVQAHQVEATGGAQLARTPNESPYPREAIDVLRARGDDARLFNEYHWGGYLIVRVPELPVFIDGRADVHGDRLIDKYIRVTRLLPGWREVLDEYGVNLVLIEKDTSLDAAFGEDNQWEPVFTGRIERVYARKTATATRPAV